MEKKVKILESLCEELFSLMSVQAKITVEYDKKEDTYKVNVSSPDSTGLLIGRKGENLTSIQTVLGTMFRQKTGDKDRVLVNIGDYREKEEDYLKDLAESSHAKVTETGTEQRLYNLTAWQRRFIHIYLSEKGGVDTESEGEGEERCLVIKPKSS